jgi:hypothetical protein
MALRDNINRAYADQQKLRNAAPSQGISPLAERTANNNRNADSLKMAGTQQAQQGAMTQLAKDPQAVQTGALAQQQQQAAQQRGLQEQQFQPQADTGVKSIEEFQSDAIEKAQEAVDQEAQKWSQTFAAFGSLGQRVSQAVREEMAAGGQVVAQFQLDEANLDKATQALAVGGNTEEVKGLIQDFTNEIQSGNSDAAIKILTDNFEKFNVDTAGDTGAALTQIFSTLGIDSSVQQEMITSALVDGIVDPDSLTIDFMMGQGILTTDADGEIPELGLSVEQIEDIVGPDWKNMTTAQIADELEVELEEESDRDDIIRELSNPNIDSARKAELQRELQLLDASGTTSAEAAAQRAVERVEQADQIAIGGKLQSVEEVLDDENIKTKSNDLLLKIQEDPENAAKVLEQWKQDNPGYEDMGDWVLENQQKLAGLEEQISDVSEIIEKRNEEAKDFVTKNELFGSDPAVENILKELGFNTEGFGILGNDPETNATYQSLVDAAKNRPNEFALFKSNLINMDPEDMKGLAGADIKTLLDVLGTDKGMEDFNFYRELNNKLDTTDEKDMGSVLTNVFPDNHPLKNIATSPETAQAWLNDLKELKSLGVSMPELEALENIFDVDPKDGKIDNPADIAKLIKSKVGEGFNLGNYGTDNTTLNSLKKLIEDTDVDFTKNIKRKITQKHKDWDDTVGEAGRQGEIDNQDIDLNEPWINDPNKIGEHPKIAWLANPKRSGLGGKRSNNSERRNQSRNILKALYKDPDIFKNYLNESPRPSFTNWFHKNIGVGNGRGNWDRQAGAFKSQMQAIGGYDSWVGGSKEERDAALLAGIEKTFGSILKDLNTKKTTYDDNATKISTYKEGNPYQSLMDNKDDLD